MRNEERKMRKKVKSSMKLKKKKKRLVSEQNLFERK
jgi:hypothetical protein